jgi:copper homeostasis protein
MECTPDAVANGADGVVFGILEADGRVDITRTRRLRSLVGSREVVFHRAFDVAGPVPGGV